MMKAIIDGKLYDTDKAEKIYDYRRRQVIPGFCLPSSMGYVEWREVTILLIFQ